MLNRIWYKSLFALILITVIVSQQMEADSWLHTISKSLIMISIGVAMLIDSKGKWSLLKVFLLLAILLSLAGDLLLTPMYDLFLPGLVCFVVAHLAYILCFLQVPNRPLELSFVRRNPWAIFMMILFAGGMFMKLREGAGELAWAVAIYIIVISIMALTALNREKAVRPKGYQLVVLGALLFMVSDSVLSWHLFVKEVPSSGLWILSTYGLAQYLIARGLIDQIQEEITGEGEPT